MLSMDAARRTAVKTFNSRGCFDAPIAESFPDRFSKAYIIELNHFLDVVQGDVLKYEPQHDKTNKMTVRPAKTQISLGIRPV